MTNKEKVAKLRAALLHGKMCWYGAMKCTHPELRAKREIARLLGEPFDSKVLDEEERQLRGY